MFVRVTIAAAAVICAGLWTAQPSPVAADTDPRDDPKTQAGIPEEQSGFLSGIRNRLKQCHGRIARLGEPLLESIRARQTGDVDTASQASNVEATKAAWKSAVLARECAEIELKGYLEVTFPQELATYKQELAEAQDDLRRAKARGGVADERFEKIKKLSQGSASDVQLEYRFEVGGILASLEQKNAGFAIEMVESKLKVLNEFTKDQRTKELQSKIKKALSDELRTKASMELEEGKRVRLSRTKREMSDSQKKALRLLEEAFSIDGTIRGKLEQLTKNGKSDAGLQKEIADSTNQLEKVIDRAEAEDALARFVAVKNAIGGAADRKPRSRSPLPARQKRQAP